MNRRRRSRREDDNDVQAMTASLYPISIITNERRDDLATRRLDDSAVENNETDSSDEADVRDMAPNRMVFNKNW